jgi:glycosyltransferase involved in cell wall biosynthesis
MRVTFLTQSLGYAGAERQLVVLAAGLQAASDDVTVVTFYGGPLEGDLSSAGVKIMRLGKRPGLWTPRFVTKLVRTINRSAPDIVYSFLEVPNIAVALSRSWLTARRVVWGVRSSVVSPAGGGWRSRITYAVSRGVSNMADCIIANSSAGAETYRSKAPRQRIHVVHNGIDTNRFRPNDIVAGQMRRDLGIPDDAWVLGHVGRLDPIKDHRTFLRAAAQLASSDHRAIFVCVGGGDRELRGRLRAMTAASGISDRVRWLGQRDDREALYPAFNILTSTSTSEGFPNVVAEAMACGVPCVVTSVGESAEIVGDTGIVVMPGNPDAVVRGWRSLAHADPRRSSRCRQRIVERYSIATLLTRTQDIFADLLTMSDSSRTCTLP